MVGNPRLRQRVRRFCRKGFGSLHHPEVALFNSASGRRHFCRSWRSLQAEKSNTAPDAS